MVLVVVTIRAEPETDTEVRVFGKAVDQTLNSDFPNTQPEKILKNPDGTILQTSKAFTHTEILDLPEGSHTIKFAPSSLSGYTWKAAVIINRIHNLGEQTGLTSINQYSATFEVYTRTWAEIRKAINEADRYLERLYQTVDWTKPDGTKVTYGLIKACPGFPIAIKLKNWDYSYGIPLCYDLILSPESPYKMQLGAIYEWHATAKVVAVKEPEFETYEATVLFGCDGLNPRSGTYQWVDIAKVNIRYGPDPDDATRMKAEIELSEWYHPEIQGDVYFGAEPDPDRPGLWRPKKIIGDAQRALGTKVTMTTSSWGCFPSMMYWLGESLLAANYWWFYSLKRSRVYPYMTSILDDYKLNVGIRAPLILGNRVDYPDNWLTLRHEHNRICDVWNDLPRTTSAASHWSSLCGPGAWIFFDHDVHRSYCPGLYDIIEFGKIAALDNDAFDLGILPLAIFIMNKHGSPSEKIKYDLSYAETVCGVPIPTVSTKYIEVSAEDLLMNGYNSITKTHPPMKEAVYRVLRNENPWEPDKPIQGEVTIWWLAEALAAYSILGYGFNNKEAQKIADALADWILDLQWGVKEGEEGKGRLYIPHHGAWTPFTVSRPDHRGGFYHRYTIYEDKVHWARRPPRDWLQQLIIDFFGWETPGALGIFTPTSTEGTICAVTALRIYEYYKWRLR